MIMQDKLEKERADAKNAVEEYVYEMRDKLSGALAEFMLETVIVLFLTYIVYELLAILTWVGGLSWSDLG